jgi:hypothetical protein
MRIGEDYPKIEWEVFGFELLEPNAFIGDTIIAAVAIGLYFKTRSLNRIHTTSFNYLWMWFFLVFGIGFFVGGVGHLMYNYFGIYGKYGAWFIGIFSSLLLELAMVSQLLKYKVQFEKMVFLKAFIAIVSLTFLVTTTDLSATPLKGLVIPTINSFIGLLFALAYLGYCYTKTKSREFRYLYWSILVLLPTILFQGLKINLHQWFDRNDVSHVLIIITLLLYFTSLRKVQRSIF